MRGFNSIENGLFGAPTFRVLIEQTLRESEKTKCSMKS